MNFPSWLTRLPLLVVVLLLVLAGAWAYLQDGQDQVAGALIAAALVILGAWLAVEVIAEHHRMHNDSREPEPEDDDAPL